MITSPLGVYPAVVSETAVRDVRRLPELAGSAEERRWEASWTAWAQGRSPQGDPEAAAARAARWAGHRRPRGRRFPDAG